MENTIYYDPFQFSTELAFYEEMTEEFLELTFVYDIAIMLFT